MAPNLPPPGFPAEFHEDWKNVRERIARDEPNPSIRDVRWRRALERLTQMTGLLKEWMEKCECREGKSLLTQFQTECNLCRRTAELGVK